MHIPPAAAQPRFSSPWVSASPPLRVSLIGALALAGFLVVQFHTQ